MQAYMKSAMPYYGVSSVPLRAVTKDLFARFPLASEPDWRDTVLAIWDEARYREERYVATELSGHRSYRAYQTPDAMPLYEHLVVNGAWWDHVDAVAIHRIGPILRDYPDDVEPVMRAWSTDADMWRRRSSIICQVGAKADTDFGSSLRLHRAEPGRHRVLHPQGHRLGVAAVRVVQPVGDRALRAGQPRPALGVEPTGGAQEHREVVCEDAQVTPLDPITPLGTPFSTGAVRVLLLGAGELGKEVVIELQRFGVEVIAVDRYTDAPAMQVAHRAHVIDMLDPTALRKVIADEQPHLVVPEVEAIATDELVALEADGQRVVPTARATRLTMNREGIRRLAAEELGLPTSPYRFASTEGEYDEAIEAIGVPCVVKPVMSSSGKGQSTVSSVERARDAWEYARANARVVGQPVIVEGFVEFDYEITLLTVRHVDGVTFCPPIGHVQVDGDYRESWQPQPMSAAALDKAQDVAAQITEALGGWGVFGVELFVRGDDVLFSEVSPRPHDTGMVTMVSQPLSEFALHARAILGLPVRDEHVAVVAPGGVGASAVVLAGGGVAPRFDGVADALRVPTAQVRLFGKPDAPKPRRLAVALAAGASVDEARSRATRAAAAITVGFDE